MRAKSVAFLAVAGAMALSLSQTGEAADTQFQLRNVEFKENGRLDAELVGLCDAKQSVRDAVARLHAKNKKQPAGNLSQLDIRVDKIARLGMGNSGVGWGGLEFGVTAILTDQPDVQAQFLCRERVIGAGGRSAYCSSINACSVDVSKKILEWLKIVKPAQ